MVLLDSNIFIVDRFFPRDSLYSQNKTFVEKLDSIDAAISSFTLLEVCGAASFRLSVDELSAWLFTFGAMYPVYVLDVHGLRTNDCEAWWSTFMEEAAANIAKKMTFGDSVLLREAEIMTLKRSSPGTQKTSYVAPGDCSQSNGFSAPGIEKIIFTNLSPRRICYGRPARSISGTRADAKIKDKV